jgi:hypothetical protein
VDSEEELLPGKKKLCLILCPSPSKSAEGRVSTACGASTRHDSDLLEGQLPSKGSVVELYAGSLLRNGADRYDAKLAASRVHERLYLDVATIDSA